MQKLVYFIFLLLLSYSCHAQQDLPKDKQKLTKILYSNYGGRLGWKESFVITQDSVTYKSLIASTQESHKYQDTLSADAWKELVSSFDLQAFKSIQNGPKRAFVDGTDTKYTVVLDSGEEYSFINVKEINRNKKANLFLKRVDALKNQYKKTAETK